MVVCDEVNGLDDDYYHTTPSIDHRVGKIRKLVEIERETKRDDRVGIY